MIKLPEKKSKTVATSSEILIPKDGRYVPFQNTKYSISNQANHLSDDIFPNTFLNGTK